MVGWSNVSVHILEYCSELELDKKDKFYIEKYLPTLNRKFSSSYSLKVNRSLLGLLIERQTKNRLQIIELNQNFNANSMIWVYSYPDFKLMNNCRRGANFKSIIDFKKWSRIRISNKTIYNYIDTLTPYKGLLFLSADIISTEYLKIVKDNCDLTPNYIAKPIWVYLAKNLNMVSKPGTVESPFKSILQASSFLKISPSTISDLLNKKIGSSAGYYFFDHVISDSIKFDLLTLPNIRDKISKLRKEVWVYDLNINLIDDKPFSSQQEMLRILGLKRFRTILNYIDTGILYKNFYFFTKEITKDTKENLRPCGISNNKNNDQYAKSNKKAKLCPQGLEFMIIIII